MKRRLKQNNGFLSHKFLKNQNNCQKIENKVMFLKICIQEVEVKIRRKHKHLVNNYYF